jgi:transposase
MLIGYDPHVTLPEDHLARLVEVLVEEAVIVEKGERGPGQPGYDPRLCLKVLIYGYATGVRSSRQLEKHCNESLPYLFLTRGDTPSYRTLCSFRVESRELLEKVWTEGFAVAKSLGMKRLGRIAVDSTKLRANASSEMVIGEDEYDAIRQELKAILEEAEARDKAEDAEGYEGETQTGKKPENLQMRDILRKVRRQISRGSKDGDNDADPPKDEDLSANGVTQRMRSRIEETLEAIDEAESEGRKHLCVTDPDARMMLGGVEKKVRECHSLEMAIDKDCGLLVADEVTQMCVDNERLIPLVKAAEKNEPDGVVAVDGDSGYYNSESLSYLIESGVDVCVPDSVTAGQLHRGVAVTGRGADRMEYDQEKDIYTCPQGNILTLKPTKGDPDNVKRYQSIRSCRGCSLYNECIVRYDGKPAKASHKRLKISHCPEEVLEAMERFNDPDHRKRYHMRGSFIESVNGFVRGALDFDRWLLRGRDKVRAEGKLITTAYQLRTLHKAWAAALTA